MKRRQKTKLRKDNPPCPPLLRGAGRGKSHSDSPPLAGGARGGGSSRNAGGYALLVVLGMLAIFAVLGIAFSMRMRMEETSSFSYKNYVLVNDVAKAAVIAAQDELQYEKEGDDGVPFSGDEGSWTQFGFCAQPDRMVDYSRTGAYDSHVNRWYCGISGRIGSNAFDVRRFVRDKENQYWHQMGTDEDPVGDLYNDDAPGFADVDDDMDGLIDEDRLDEPMVLSDGDSNNLFDEDYILDDDEDGRIDEDRRDVSPIGKGIYAFGEGIDTDSDAVGIFDECAKLHLNLAGNTVYEQAFLYNEALGPWELDLGMFLAARLVPDSAFMTDTLLFDMQELANEIVAYKYGDDGYPGVAGYDDMGTSNPTSDSDFVYLAKSGIDSKSGVIESLVRIVGSGLDENNDGVSDDETEVYIGRPIQLNSEYWRFSRDWMGEVSYREVYLPGDGLDNDCDGEVDEAGESVDGPSEFNPSIPARYDTGEVADKPWLSLEEFRTFLNTDPAGISDLLLAGKSLDDIYDALAPYLTLHSQSPLYSPAFYSSEGTYYRRALYPNLLSTYSPWQLLTDDRSGKELREDLSRPDSANPPAMLPPAWPNDITYFYPASIDDDNDWRWATRDEEGLFTKHDLNENFLPDGDWDGDAEPYPPDPDLDWPPVLSDDYRLAELKMPPNEYDQSLDLDNDRWMGDHGDFNADGEVRYDPEWGVNEDPPGRADGGDDVEPGLPNVDDDIDLDDDFRDVQVSAAVSDPSADEIDNDGDGIIDEAGETYVAAFDDDEDGRWDEDGPEIQFWANLLDCIDEPPLVKLPEIQEYQDYYELYDDDYDPSNTFIYDASLAAGFMADGMAPTEKSFTMWTSRMVAQATPSYDAFLDTEPEYRYTGVIQGAEMEVTGVEAIRINEVCAYPMIRLQMEHDDSRNQTPWRPYTVDGQRSFFAAEQSTMDKEHEWIFNHIPPGEYRMILYRPEKGTVQAKMTSGVQYVWPSITINGDPANGKFGGALDFDEAKRSAAMLPTETIEVDDKGQLKIQALLTNWPGLPNPVRFTALDYIELLRWRSEAGNQDIDDDDYDPQPDLDLQYIELVNLSDREYPIDLSGWTIEVGNNPIRGIYSIPPGTLIFPDDPTTPDAQENYLAICRDPMAVLEAYYPQFGLTFDEMTDIQDLDYKEQLEELKVYGLIQAREGVDLLEISTGLVTKDDGGVMWDRLSVANEVVRQPEEMSIRLIGACGVLLDEVQIADPATALYGGQEGEPSEQAAKATMPLQIFEKGDPTAIEYEISGPVRKKIPNHWARFYAKDALIIDRDDPFKTSWEWDPNMTPDSPDPSDTGTEFFCYHNDNKTKESTVIFTWLNPPIWKASNSGKDRFLRVRVFGEDGRTVGKVLLENSEDGLLMKSGDVSSASTFIRITPWEPWTGPSFDPALDPSNYNDLRSYLLTNDRYRSYLHIEITHVKPTGSDYSAFKYAEFCSFGDDPEAGDASWYTAGSPAAPNVLYEPFYYDQSQEHKQALVRNSRLANFYDLSRIATGGEFEVLGAEKAAKLTEFIRLTGSPTERAPGLININTAPKPVLMALPWAEPEWADPRSIYHESPDELLNTRYQVAERIASAIINYRETMLNGFDGKAGKANVDDNSDLQNRIDEHYPLIGYSERNWPGSDDPPFNTVGDLVILFTNPSSDLYLGFGCETNENPLTDIPGMENATPSSVFGRIANLATVRSDVMTVRARGKVLDPDGGTTAEKLIEAVIER